MAREMHPDDLTHLANLFHIHREASAHGGGLKPIADAVMAELKKYSDALVEPEPAEADAEKEPADPGHDMEPDERAKVQEEEHAE